MYKLTKWNEAIRAVEEAKSVDELKDLRDKAEAMRLYAKQVGESLKVQNNICEIKLRAERRIGGMLKEMPKQFGSRGIGKKVESHDATSLKDVGLDKHQSSRYQKIADLTDDAFERIIEETKADEQELTEALMLNTVKKIERAAKIEAQKGIIEQENLNQPSGEYDVIVIDPPWKYGENYDPIGQRGTTPYPQMSQDDLKKIKLPSKDDCVLWLWVTNAFIREAFELCETWGFEPKAFLTWDKQHIGVGRWLRNVTEHCIIAVKGKPVWENTTHSTIIRSPRTAHSEKPEVFYQMVENICHGRKLDYFARKNRKGWDVYGDEVEGNK